MKTKKFDCLRDCKADCCRSQELSFPFTDNEAKYLLQEGSQIEKIETTIGPLYKLKSCAFLKENLCLIHNTDKQPICCRDTKPGSPICLTAREK